VDRHRHRHRHQERHLDGQPHVAGVAALYLDLFNTATNAASVNNAIKTNATSGVITLFP
jgi:subtilisin family serine protease